MVYRSTATKQSLSDSYIKKFHLGDICNTPVAHIISRRLLIEYQTEYPSVN